MNPLQVKLQIFKNITLSENTNGNNVSFVFKIYWVNHFEKHDNNFIQKECNSHEDHVNTKFVECFDITFVKNKSLHEENKKYLMFEFHHKYKFHGKKHLNNVRQQEAIYHCYWAKRRKEIWSRCWNLVIFLLYVERLYIGLLKSPSLLQVKQFICIICKFGCG